MQINNTTWEIFSKELCAILKKCGRVGDDCQGYWIHQSLWDYEEKTLNYQGGRNRWIRLRARKIFFWLSDPPLMCCGNFASYLSTVNLSCFICKMGFEINNYSLGLLWKLKWDRITRCSGIREWWLFHNLVNILKLLNCTLSRSKLHGMFIPH